MRCFCLKAFSTSMNSKRAAGSNGIGGNRLIFPWESHRTRKSQHMPPPTPLHFTPQVWAKSILWHTMLLCYLRNANMRSVIPGCTRPRGALMVDPPLVPVVYFQATSPTGSSEQRDLWAPDQPASHYQAVHNKCTTGYVCIWFREHSSIHSHFAKIPVLISSTAIRPTRRMRNICLQHCHWGTLESLKNLFYAAAIVYFIYVYFRRSAVNATDSRTAACNALPATKSLEWESFVRGQAAFMLSELLFLLIGSYRTGNTWKKWSRSSINIVWLWLKKIYSQVGHYWLKKKVWLAFLA